MNISTKNAAYTLTFVCVLLLLGAGCTSSTHNRTNIPADNSVTPVKSMIPSPVIISDMTQAGRAVQAWAALIESGCDPLSEGTQVWTPIEARILRNTPYAMRGYDFTNTDLTQFFDIDGGNWYEAQTKDIVLPFTVETCIEKLQKHENQLRETMDIDPEAEAVLTANASVFEALWLWGHESNRLPYADVSIRKNDKGQAVFESTYPDCVGSGDCGGYQIECLTDSECYPLAAG